MIHRRTKVPRFQFLNRAPVVLFSLILLGVITSAEVATAQTRSSANIPGPAIREGNRSMDDYDRTINRMKNDARAANERRRNLFPQINEDFQQIQILHNEIVRMLQPDKGLNYDRLADLTGDLKRRSTRLRENLALPELEQSESQATHSKTVDEPHMKKTIGKLHDLVVSFIASPIFKNLGVVDAKMIDATTENLDNIIFTSDEIKREAKLLSKSRK